MENTYTQKEIIKKYKWPEKGMADFVKYAKYRGVILEKISTIRKNPYLYKIIDDSIATLEWKTYPKDPYFEVTKEGFVRTAEGKRLTGAEIRKNGYISVTNSKNKQSYRVHRMVLETFSPVENMEALVVDHIDGIRSNNHIDNLRWATHVENMTYKEENR